MASVAPDYFRRVPIEWRAVSATVNKNTVARNDRFENTDTLIVSALARRRGTYGSVVAVT